MSAQPDPGLVEAALEYARRGKPVFPCGADKRPLTSRGFYDATTDEKQIAEWWRKWPTALIGIPTGRASGLVVVDCDVRDGLDGVEAFELLSAPYGGAPHTVQSLTPSGGTHHLFAAPDVEVRNSASRLAPGVDVRGEGGYIIAPPSMLPDGRRYEWEASNPRQPAPMPAWLLRLAGSHVRPEPVVERVNGKVVSGQRNAYLASYAGRMAHAGFDREQIMEAVRAENTRTCNPPLTERELDATIAKSATRWVLKAQSDGVAPVTADLAVEEERRATEGVPYIAAVDAVRAMRAPEWLIEGIIERGAFGELFGPWGGGKSAVLCDIACRLAHGMPIHGRPTRPTLVVMIVGEGQQGFVRRIAAWAAANNRTVPANLILIPEPIAIGDPEGKAALRATLARIVEDRGQPIGLLTIDTLARNFGKGDENSNSDMGRWVNSVQECARPFGCAVLALHHPGHANKDRARGATALPGALDVDLRLEQYGAGMVGLVSTKVKEGAQIDRMTYQLRGHDIDIEAVSVSVVVAEEVSSFSGDEPEQAERKARPLDREVFSVLRRLMARTRANLEADGRDPGKAYIDARSWRETCEDEGVIKGKNPRQQWNGCRARLQEAGLVIEHQGGFVPVLTSAEAAEDYGDMR